MAALTVFVDEAVQGDFPSVCARTGRPSDIVVQLERRQGGVGGAALLLILLGPLGWLVLAVLAVARPGEPLVIRVPYTEAALAEDARYRRISLAAVTLGVASLVLAVVFHGMSQGAVWLVIAAASFVVGLFFHVRAALAQVGVSLDASRRWVTLSNVHAHFVEATCAMPSGRPRTRV